MADTLKVVGRLLRLPNEEIGGVTEADCVEAVGADCCRTPRADWQ